MQARGDADEVLLTCKLRQQLAVGYKSTGGGSSKSSVELELNALGVATSGLRLRLTFSGLISSKIVWPLFILCQRLGNPNLA